MSDSRSPSGYPAEDLARSGGWTGAVRRYAVRTLPPEKLLPDSQPAYMASWIYVFGVLTVASLVVVVATGCVLALAGPGWWHASSVGKYVNSLHLWSVELFMFVMVIHLWGKFFMAAWRGRRAMTWMTGAVCFLTSIGAAFTGYLVQQNFDSQWISGQAKDGLNSVGIGAWFNVLDFGQMLMWHIVLLPLVLGLLTAWHVLLVRRRGIVPPIDAAVRHPDERPAAPEARP
ncbi:cytochrome b N-terminal domain-containing protein [Streptomyces sp. SP17BM10]|uniref:cytochrome b N-terminal domain-containing protein n=1 Tax=Streptomyces sp. SP17BM10 TaxID=3002530 RepID=UPI002E7A2A52|nr:cytochrome b N-terminal domain-containing protein [Streptomyces sp. SP17BM10]MEE1784937.1 cytochrome b N-terminal domain-containing protein [Streptomyces sp. SP17BM10]